MVTVVDGKQHQQKNIYVRENLGDKSSFLKHMEVGNQSKSLVGTTLDDKMAVVTRVSDGKKVKYSSGIVKSKNNLRRLIRKSLSLKPKRKKTMRRKKIIVGKTGKKGKKDKKGTRGKKMTKGKKGNRGKKMTKGKKGVTLKKRTLRGKGKIRKQSGEK